MFRSGFCKLLGFAAILALGLAARCTPSPPGGDGDGNGNASTCRAQGDGCEADTDCCVGLACVEWTCEPTGEVPDDGGGGAPVGHPGGVVADHLAVAAFESVPTAYINLAKATFRVFYGHTSHGSQIVTGMNMLDT